MKKRKRLKKKLLKILIPIVITLILGISIYVGYKIIFKEKEKTFLETIETGTYANITNYVIYGIHMNIEGNFTLPENIENVEFVLSNGTTEINVPWLLTEGENNTYHFKTSEFINEGLNLEKLPQEDLYLLIKTKSKNEENELVTKYYSVENDSIYKNLEYYTLTKNNKNNKIDIEWNTYEECPTLRFRIKESKLPKDVYDITLDPGHDASDSGKAVCFTGTNLYDPTISGYCYNGGTLYKESDLNLAISHALKEKLENLGYKVIMTRETKEDYVKIYDPMGSATMANDTKSKFSLAIHHNSSGVDGGVSYLKGVELYVANDTNFDFAKIIIKNLKELASTTTSSKTLYLSEDGIYQKYFEPEDIDEEHQYWNTNMISYYYIREVGGVSTHAAQNIARFGYPKNEHYDSNNTAEPYLFELGYMDNVKDLNNILNNKEGYANAIAQALQNYLEQE